jgi:ribosome maturation protein SDO1
MPKLDKCVIAKYEKNGLKFEIYVDAEKAWELKEGKSISIYDIVPTDEIFKDAKKGLRASPSDLIKVFNTDDPETIIKIIILEGEIPMPSKLKAKKLEELKKAIALRISKLAINPQNGLPHPPDRILNAMEQARVQISLSKSIDEQVNEVIQSIKRIIPIRIELKKVELIIPSQYVYKAYNIVHAHKVLKEQYLNDGSWRVVVEIPTAIYGELMEKLERVTNGNVTSKDLEI